MFITRRQLLSAAVGSAATMIEGCAISPLAGLDGGRHPDNLPLKDESGVLRLRFFAPITRGYGNGDCILVEYEEGDETKKYGLIDAGRKIQTQEGASTAVLDFLNDHRVDSLEFLLISHQHSDHYGDAAAVLSSVPVRRLYMKQYDQFFSGEGAQRDYEAILRAAIMAGVQIVGIDPRSVDPGFSLLQDVCPSMTNTHKKWLAEHPEALSLCQAFDADNVAFTLGSASFRLVNWESWDENGNPWDMGDEAQHEIVSNDNHNSLGVIARVGGTTALLTGDMLTGFAGARKVSNGERISREVGEVEFFKLGHHGTLDANSISFLNAIAPQHAQITNDAYGATRETLSWLSDHGVDYAFTTSDPVATVVTLDAGGVSMDVEKRARFARVNAEAGADIMYVPADDEADWLSVSYHEVAVEATSWDELANLIANNASAWVIDKVGTRVAAEALQINVSAIKDTHARSCITVALGQRITLTASNEVHIVRSTELLGEPLFFVEGNLILEGPIVLDGNSSELTGCSASLIQVNGGILDLSGVILQNNCKACSSGLENEAERVCYGGAILALAGDVILRNGTCVRSNTCLLDRDGIVERRNVQWRVGGGGIAVVGGRLNIDVATVESNVCYAHMSVSDDDTHSNAVTAAVHALGGGLYYAHGEDCAWKGLILRDNSVHNESYLASPSERITYKASAYGGGCWVEHSVACMEKSEVSVNQLTFTGNAACKGAGIYVLMSRLDIVSSSILSNKSLSVGGGVYAKQSEVQLADCSISENNAQDAGGGIVVLSVSSELKIANCTFEDNVSASSRGGAVWTNCPTIIEGSTFVRNSSSIRGGAIYANGGLRMDGGVQFAENVAKKGADLSVGTASASFYAIRIESGVDFEVGKHATTEPLDEGPVLTVTVHSCRSEARRAVIETVASSLTGLVSVSVNGKPCVRNRFVVFESGTYEVVATDLAGRQATEVVEVVI